MKEITWEARIAIQPQGDGDPIGGRDKEMAKTGQARGVKQVESTNVSDQLMFQVMKTEGSKTFLE